MLLKGNIRQRAMSSEKTTDSKQKKEGLRTHWRMRAQKDLSSETQRASEDAVDRMKV